MKIWYDTSDIVHFFGVEHQEGNRNRISRQRENKMKKICCFASALILALGNSTNSYAADGIRVGYEEDYGMLMSSSVHSYPGYGYEYLNKIVEYTQDDYYIEFVPCTLDEGLYFLQNGLIDIYAPVSKFSTWEETYLFSEASFARELRFLASTKEDYVPTGNTKELEGKKIAVQLHDPMLASLEQFILDEGVSVEINEIEIKNYGEFLETTSYDYILASSLWMLEDLSVAFSISTHETYLMAMPHMTYLMDNLNTAMYTVDMTEYMYQERLFFKYFTAYYPVEQQVLKSDYELMKLKNSYYVGIHDLDSPFAYRNVDGELVGIYPEILSGIAEAFSVAFEFVVFEDVGASQMEHQIDFKIQGLQERESSQMSIPLLSLPFQIVRNGSFSGNEEEMVIGTLDYYDLTLDDMNHVVSGEQLFLGSSPEELLLALQHGAVDVLFLLEYTVEHLDLEAMDVVIQDVPFVYSPVISYESGFSSDKITAMNKVISQFDEMEMEFLLQKHLLPQEKDLSWRENLEKYPIVLQGGFLFLSVGCLFALIQERNGKRKAMVSLQVEQITGLATEVYFREKAQGIIQGNPKKYGMISCEIEQFHAYQELYDKKQTDGLLKECASMIQSLSPVLSCHSGDGLFLFLMEVNDFKTKIQSYLSKDSEIVKKCSAKLSGNQNIALTFGICDSTLNEDVGDLITFAQYAQFWGVGLGHHNVYEFDEEMRSNQKNSHNLLVQAEKGFSEREFSVYYQPMMDMLSKKLIGMEALLRWKRPEGILVAGEFINLFEEYGLAVSMDFYVLEELCTFLEQNKGTILPTVWMNLSAQTLLTEDFVERVDELIKKYSLVEGSLGFELKESIFVQYSDVLLEKMARLGALGVGFAMDDFGAEMGSYSLWTETEIQYLKLDRQFLLKCKNEKKAEESMKYVLQQGKNASIQILVECVETFEESQFLKRLGCQFGQGKFFGEAKSQEAFFQDIKGMDIKRTVVLEKASSSLEMKGFSSMDVTSSLGIADTRVSQTSENLEEAVAVNREESLDSEMKPSKSFEEDGIQSPSRLETNYDTTVSKEKDKSLFSPLEEFEP